MKIFIKRKRKEFFDGETEQFLASIEKARKERTRYYVMSTEGKNEGLRAIGKATYDWLTDIIYLAELKYNELPY